MYGIQFGMTVFAAFRLESLQVRRGLGHSVFIVMLRFHNQAPSAAMLPHLIHISGEIRTSAGDHVAEIRPAALQWSQNRPDDTLYLYALVTFRALSMLTDSRASTNEAVQLAFGITMNLEGRDERATHIFEVIHRVAGSDWLSILEQARHTSFHVVEVPLEGVLVPAGLKAASDRYRAAIRHLQLCQWDDAIAECRQVFDDLAGPIGPTEIAPPWQDYADQRKVGWTFAQRCAAIRAVVRHATHEAHHSGNQFTASQARYIVDLTGVAMKFYGQQLT